MLENFMGLNSPRACLVDTMRNVGVFVTTVKLC